jgi:uncharacterized protein
VDNGVLLLIVPDERVIRIEVGYGLEGTLTDAVSSRIIRHQIAPRFRTGDYPGGIAAGLRAIMGTIEGTDAASARAPSSEPQRWEGLFLAIVLAAVIGGLIGSHALLHGSAVGGVMAFAMGFSSGLLWAMVAAGLAFLGALVLAVLFRLGGGQSGGMRRDAFHGAPWLGGRSGYLESRDVFMGGGGSFGGGGASGRW